MTTEPKRRGRPPKVRTEPEAPRKTIEEKRPVQVVDEGGETVTAVGIYPVKGKGWRSFVVSVLREEVEALGNITAPNLKSTEISRCERELWRLGS